MGAAKQAGGLSTLYPPGGVLEAGWDLVHAVTAALSVLGFMELPDDEQPPASIWHHEERLEEWFAAVKQRREERFSGSGPTMQPIDDDTPGMMGNELAQQYRD